MILDDIILNKRQEVTSLKVERVEGQLSKLPDTKGFFKALKKEGLGLIAEIKKASPSLGVIRENFDPVEISKIYETAGASAISVLTDEKFFQGSLRHLSQVRKTISLPLLRKDFIIDESQIYESRLNGADAILLIVKILSDAQLKEFLSLSHKLNMDCLVEVHDKDELRRALGSEARIIGINNRDLQTFKVNTQITFDLISQIPSSRRKDLVIVSESGIKSKKDVDLLEQAGVDAILVGESLLKSKDIGKKIKELMA